MNLMEILRLRSEALDRVAAENARLRERLAEAWADGFDAGDRYARAVNPEWPRMPRNPHLGGRA